MAYINRFFKYEPEEYVHTYVPYPIDSILKLGEIAENKANRAAEYQGKFDEYLSSIKAAPGHEEWRSEIVGGIMDELNNIASKYEYTDPRFMREMSRLRGKVSANRDIQDIMSSYDTYTKTWSPIINSPEGRKHAYLMHGIIDNEGNFIQNRNRYSNLNYVPYSSPEQYMDEYLNNKLPDLIDKKLRNNSGISFIVEEFKDPTTGIVKKIPFIKNTVTREKEEIRNEKTFSSLVDNLIKDFRSQISPWSKWMAAKGYDENDVKELAWRRAESFFVNRDLSESNSSYSQLNLGNDGSDKNNKNSLYPTYESGFQQSAPKVRIKDGQEYNVSGTNYIIKGKGYAGDDFKVTKTISSESDYKGNPINNIYIKQAIDLLTKELNRKPTDEEIYDFVRNNLNVNLQISKISLSQNKEIYERINFFLFPNKAENIYGGPAERLLYYSQDEPYVPKTFEEITKNKTIRDAYVSDILYSGNDFTGSYPSYKVNFIVDGNSNKKENISYFAVDPQVDPFSVLEGKQAPPDEKSYLMSSVESLPFRSNGIAIARVNGVTIPIRYIPKENNKPGFVEFYNPYKKDFEKVFIPKEGESVLKSYDGNSTMTPLSYVGSVIYKTLTNGK